MIWNPFAHLVKSKKYPYSHLVSSSLITRFEDTLAAFYGTFIDSKRMGVLDYFLIVSRPAERLIKAIFFHHMFDTNLIFTIAMMVPLVPLFFISVAPKLILASILTIACSPIIVCAHLFMQPIKYFLNKKADQIKIKKIQKQLRFRGDSPFNSSLKQVHPCPGISNALQSIPTDQEVTLETLKEESEELHIHLFMKDTNCDEIFVGIQNVCVFVKLARAMRFDDPLSGLVGFFALDEENLEAVKMALHLNRFGITKAAHINGAFTDLENKMQALHVVGQIRSSVSEALRFFSKPTLSLTFCYAGIANRMQIQEFENGVKPTDTRTPPKRFSRAYSPHKKIT